MKHFFLFFLNLLSVPARDTDILEGFMKNIILFSVALLTLGGNAYAAHKCSLSTNIQVYDEATLKLKRVEYGTTNFFEVTSDPHETPKLLDILGKNEKLGFASCWTGTLLGTSEGDVIQANASFKISDREGSAAILFSLDSSFSQTTVVLDNKIGDELFLIPVDLKCVKIK